MRCDIDSPAAEELGFLRDREHVNETTSDD
jgi:hypothetical protein